MFQVGGLANGKISNAEMQLLIEKLYGKKLDDKLLKEMFAAADSNQDGEIDLQEFIVRARFRVLAAMPARAPPHFHTNAHHRMHLVRP